MGSIAGGPDSFLRHRGLVLVAAGGAVTEAGVLALVAPGALPVAPQATALPSVAAYHDLRWLFTCGAPWQAFAAILAVVLVARAALDATLLRLAWPRAVASPPSARSLPGPPRWSRALLSCLALTALCWALLSPAVTLAFGAAVLPFSWPLIGALPIMAGVVLVLGHGGTAAAWWRRLPPLRATSWVLASIAMLSLSAAVIAHVGLAGGVAVAGLSGLLNARAWYGMAAVAAGLPARPPSAHPARALLAVPLAPAAGVLVLALVVGGARLLFTGAIHVPGNPQTTLSIGPAGTRSVSGGDNSKKPGGSPHRGAVLVVEGWGSWCCDAANNLRPLEPGMAVRQFSYRGLDGKGGPLRSGPGNDDLSLPQLGDKVAAQVRHLHQVTHGPVSVVAESEGTLGVYAMLARHPGLPLGSVVLLSPIIAPGQLSFPVAGRGPAAVPSAALDELNHLVGTISPYGSDGAGRLLASVSQYGARFFSGARHAAGAGPGGHVRGLTVVPLADALTMPACGLPPGVLVVPAFHGGLLGNPAVLPMVARFIDGAPPGPGTGDQGRLRVAADAITGAAAAWRMPDVSAACP
jgi:hypothetical protein